MDLYLRWGMRRLSAPYFSIRSVTTDPPKSPNFEKGAREAKWTDNS